MTVKTVNKKLWNFMQEAPAGSMSIAPTEYGANYFQNVKPIKVPAWLVSWDFSVKMQDKTAEQEYYKAMLAVKGKFERWMQKNHLEHDRAHCYGWEVTYTLTLPQDREALEDYWNFQSGAISEYERRDHETRTPDGKPTITNEEITEIMQRWETAYKDFLADKEGRKTA